MATPRPFFAGSSIPTVSTRSPLIFPQPQCDGQQLGFSIGAAPADRLGSTARTPHHRRDHTGLRRKRLSSPHSGGPLVKRRVAEEQMVGDLQNLSLNVQDGSTSKSLQAARWRELESRLSDPDSDSETASSTAADAGPRLVVTDELRSAMAAPAPDFLPCRPDNSMAVVLWRPPPIQLPPDPSPPACPSPTSASSPDGMEAAESPPPAAVAAYDFSRFAVEEEERTTMAPDQRYHFRGGPGQAGAAPLFPGFGQSPVQMEDDELMEL